MPEIIELKHPSRRMAKGSLLDSELITLAKIRFLGHIEDNYRDKDQENLEQQRDLVSLERFDLVHHYSLYVGGRYKGWAWGITEEGIVTLDARKPRHYGCRCENAIKIFCVCAERTYCPNPEHTGNGCNGTHD